MPHEVAHVGARIRGDVEQLALQRARPRVTGHVAHRVAASLAAREAGVAELADQLRRVGERHVVHLDVLARGDVALAQRHVLLDHIREGVELVRRDATEGQLHPDHLHVRLALPVDALLQAELDELVALELTLEEARRLGVEVVELTLENRDHMPGDVLQYLRVLQRAAAGAAVLLLGGVQRCGLHRGGLPGRSAERSNVPKGNLKTDDLPWHHVLRGREGAGEGERIVKLIPVRGNFRRTARVVAAIGQRPGGLGTGSGAAAVGAPPRQPARSQPAPIRRAGICCGGRAMPANTGVWASASSSRSGDPSPNELGKLVGL